MSFTKDLKIGNKYEDKIEAYYQQKGFETHRKKDYTYDIGALLKIECKDQWKKCQKHGNLAIEVSCSGKPSGLTTTEAFYYINSAYYEDKIISLQTEVRQLKQLIAENNYPLVKGGDGHRAMMHLIPVKAVVKISKIIDVE